jgi:hypothetical protein
MRLLVLGGLRKTDLASFIHAEGTYGTYARIHRRDADRPR